MTGFFASYVGKKLEMLHVFFQALGSHDHLSVLPCCDLLHCTGGNRVHYATEMSDLSHTLRGVYSGKGQLYRDEAGGEHRVKHTNLNRAVHCVGGIQQRAIKREDLFFKGEFTQLRVFTHVQMLGFINRSEFKELMSGVLPSF